MLFVGVASCSVGRSSVRAVSRTDALPSSSICIRLIWNLDLKSSRKEAEAAEEEEEEEDLTYSVVGTSARSLISLSIMLLISQKKPIYAETTIRGLCLVPH